MVLSGLYLASQSTRARRRNPWRKWHTVLGWSLALPLLLFLLTGLAWTGIWGSKLVQPWNAIPKFQLSPPHHGTATPHSQKDALTHDSLNRDGVHSVPWVLEKTALPQHAQTHRHNALTLNAPHALDVLSKHAQTHALPHYRIQLPSPSAPFWTLSTTTAAGDISSPTQEKSLYFDANTLQALGDIRFQDYPLLGKAMAVGIPLHEGNMRLWNTLLNTGTLVLILALTLSGIALWWQRRPTRSRASQNINTSFQNTLANPPKAQTHPSAIISTTALLCLLCFPLSALVLFCIMGVDIWIQRRSGE